MRKNLLFILSIGSLLFGSCDLPSQILSSSGENNSTYYESSVSDGKSSSNKSSVNDDSSKDDDSSVSENNQNVTINVNENNQSSVSSVEEAVSKIYDSVVVINVSVSGGVAAGSGVIIGENDEYSYIITCHHVIDEAISIEVTTSDNESYKATLVGGDPDSDIAVIKIKKTGLDIATFLKDSNSLRLGETSIVIGNALGILSNTVTVGVVSAINREITTSDGSTETLIQTDAAINSGNSGGGMFNSNGDLIGIVSSKYASSTIEGLGFAVPCDIALSVCNDLINQGYVTGRYKLGVTITDGYTYGSSRMFGMGSSYVEVTYISDIDEDGCAYGYLSKNQIVKSLSIDFKDESKEDTSLDDVTSASSANKFINSADLVIGDVITFGVKESYNSSIVEYIDVEITQYIYK